MTLDIGDHSLLAPIEHTATGAVYTPADGKVVITVNGHGMSNGDRVWIVDDSFIILHVLMVRVLRHILDQLTPISGKVCRKSLM